jgi:hypothetical protein
VQSSKREGCEVSSINLVSLVYANEVASLLQLQSRKISISERFQN